MSLSSSPSSSDSGSSSSSSASLSKFDPFAVHPFTNCSATLNSNDPYGNGQAYGYPYGAPFVNYNPRNPQSPTYLPSTAGHSRSSAPQKKST
ncbi:hypothetical protein BDN70DRAFT_933968 [Pholiota conissans]|uniref:Uncharacterized protein n=1 Tax=Pholiota conissans TaxID=109636 RepID=A0A9P5YY41_9AGAR|nr:hypothetical protein BDN70DRAFT_933968 [Pholiota conissans]